MKGGRSKTETKRTDSKILNSLNIPLSVETVCVFTAPVFSAIAAWAAYFLTKEVKGAGAGLTAAVLLAMIGQACRPVVKGLGMWGSVKALGRGYEYIMGVVIFVPIAVLAWFPFVTEFQTRLLFNQAFSRGLQIQRILAGGKKQKQK
ncbi:hypothetical protein ACSBR2_035703 [Camellia fascicularis]